MTETVTDKGTVTAPVDGADMWHEVKAISRAVNPATGLAELQLCGSCGLEFKPRRPWGLYCSGRCRTAAARRRAAAKELTMTYGQRQLERKNRDQRWEVDPNPLNHLATWVSSLEGLKAAINLQTAAGTEPNPKEPITAVEPIPGGYALRVIHYGPFLYVSLSRDRQRKPDLICRLLHDAIFVVFKPAGVIRDQSNATANGANGSQRVSRWLLSRDMSARFHVAVDQVEQVVKRYANQK